MEPLKVVELFAGVGGFRIGLERASDRFRVVWSNQWEPGVKRQAASDVYKARFGAERHSNEDIALVPVKEIPAHDLLVGGFPCQDYSVARTLKQAAGLQGKKGVLWWEIHRILKVRKPAFILLENVDRLLKSPTGQRGRDFAVMLASLADLGYVVEWRVINAADYGMPQRRRRVFFVAYLQRTELGKAATRTKDRCTVDHGRWVDRQGLPQRSGQGGLERRHVGW
jgi:DNA (cytosine-5)-methyltransferase 1